MTALVRCVFLSLLLAVFSTGDVTPPISPDFVYRADFRDPQTIFQAGMQSWGTCENVYYHIEGKNCKGRTSAFISTTSDENAAGLIARVKLNDPNNKIETIYVYKIRADPTFYSAHYSLMTAADKYWQKGKKKKAQKYAKLADQYRYQDEWMAYKKIPSTLIQLATTYPRDLANQYKKGPVVNNAGYVNAVTYGSQLPFPESTKGCPGTDKLKACLGLLDHREEQ